MEFFISHKNIEAVVFAKSRKNSCSFFALDVIQKGRSPPLDFDFQNSKFGGKRNGRTS